MNTEVNEYDEREMNRDVKLSDFRSMDREVYQEDIYDAFDGDIDAYKQSMKKEQEVYDALEREKLMQTVREIKQYRRNYAIKYFLPVIFIIIAFIPELPSWYYFTVKIIFAITAIRCILLITDCRDMMNDIEKAGYIGLIIVGAIGISGIVGARYSRNFWLLVDVAYCLCKLISFIGAIKVN